LAENKNIGQRVAQGGLLVLVEQVSIFVIGLATTSILAKNYLTPADFGVVQLASIFLGFASLFSTAGLHLPVIQSEKISPIQVSNLLWVSVAAGGITFVIASSRTGQRRGCRLAI